MNFRDLLIYLVLFVSGALFLNSCDASIADDENRAVYVWSHNDYWQDRPLYDALELGYQMIEADIHLIDGELYVAHDPPDPLKHRHLQICTWSHSAGGLNRMTAVYCPGANCHFTWLLM